MAVVSSGLLLLIPMFLILILMPVLIGIGVYRDAKARGMEPWLWTAVAVLVPYCIGLIIYLVLRTKHKGLKCGSCGTGVEPDYAVCPHCGAKLKYTCESCGKPVAADWQACAHCGAALPQGRAPLVAAAEAPSSKPLWIILGIVIGLVLLLLALFIGIPFFTFAGFAAV